MDTMLQRKNSLSLMEFLRDRYEICRHLEANSQHQSMVDSGIEANMRAQEKQSVGECYSVQCTERRKQLITENNQLLQKVTILLISVI